VGFLRIGMALAIASLEIGGREYANFLANLITVILKSIF
jgi:hypothetical protein